jgi:sugar lactone lactonase YvrE
MTRHLARFVITVGSAAALCLLIAAGAPADVRVVADGLHNPRGLALDPSGRISVAEAGSGGSGPCIPGPEGSPVCFGTTGSVARIDPSSGRTRRVATGLPSLAQRDGSRAIGPSDVAFTPSGRGYLTVGLGGNPALRRQLPPAALGMAYLDRLHRDGRVQRLVNLGDFEAANNPDRGQPGSVPDTNPNSVDASRGRVVVADAGGNDVLGIRARRASVLALIPFGSAPPPPGTTLPPGTTEIPVQPVPTSVVRGPDGALYVGQLTGFPFPEGAANVWRVAPGQQPRVFASGFTQITDIAFDARGRLYVLEIATGSMLGPPTPGALIQVRRDGRRRELEAGSLQNPTGLTIANGAAYVSNRGTDGRRGQLVRISLPGR